MLGDMTPCRMVQTRVFINVAVSVCVCVCVCMYVYMYVCVHVYTYVCMYVPHNMLQYIFVIIYSAIRMWIGFNYGAFLNSCRVSLNVKAIKVSEDVTFWVMWLFTAHSCVVALGYVAVYSTQLRGCSGLCDGVQHATACLVSVNEPQCLYCQGGIRLPSLKGNK